MHPANLLELSRKVLVCEIWRVIVFHELDHLRLDSVWAFPVTPEPFWDETGNAEDAEVNENSNFGIVIPL